MIKKAYKKLLKNPIHNLLKNWGVLFAAETAAAMRPRFRKFGCSWLREPLGDIRYPEFISIGNGVEIEPGVDFEVNVQYAPAEQRFSPELIIEDGACIRRGTSIYCNDKVVIGRDVLIGRNVSIISLSHCYEDLSVPILRQPLAHQSVIIGEGSFLGHGAIILPGVTIGKHCVIGAGAVVIEDIPDFSVAAGNPARVVKSYDAGSSAWVRARLK